MIRVALISDTHSHLGQDVIEHLKNVDEIWHAGDLGDSALIDQLTKLGTIKGVYGNIDDHVVRAAWPLDLAFECGGVRVFMTHIGGYPGRYTKRVKEQLIKYEPDLYICGHSHICKVVRDKSLNLLHMNPGACGVSGFHQFRTMLLFDCVKGYVENVRVVELGRRGQLK